MNDFNLPPLLEFLIIQYVPIKLRITQLLEACLSCCFSVTDFLGCSYHEILYPELFLFLILSIVDDFFSEVSLDDIEILEEGKDSFLGTVNLKHLKIVVLHSASHKDSKKV